MLTSIPLLFKEDWILMKKRKKLNTVRVSVTLPQVMVEDFKTKAELTGLSISRVVYLQLKARKPIIIVPGDLLSQVKGLRQVLDKIATEGNVEAEVLSTLQQSVRFHQALVGFNGEAEIYVP